MTLISTSKIGKKPFSLPYSQAGCYLFHISFPIFLPKPLPIQLQGKKTPTQTNNFQENSKFGLIPDTLQTNTPPPPDRTSPVKFASKMRPLFPANLPVIGILILKTSFNVKKRCTRTPEGDVFHGYALPDLSGRMLLYPALWEWDDVISLAELTMTHV